MRTRLLKFFFVLAALLALSGRASAQNPICSQLSFSVAYGVTATCTVGTQGVSAGMMLQTAGTSVVPVTAGQGGGIFGVALQGGGTGQTIVVAIDGMAQISVDGSCTEGQYIIVSPTTNGMGHCTASPGSNQWGGTTMQSISAAGSVYALVSPYGVGEGSSGGSSSWSSVSAGSNPNPLTMASGGSLTPAGLGIGIVEANEIYAATVSTLPSASSSNGQSYVVTDIATIGSCATGSGSNLGICRSNGTSWVWIGASGGAPIMAYYYGPQCPPGYKCYYTPADTKYDNTCTWTGTTITCTDSPFTSTAVDSGKQVGGWNTCETDLAPNGYGGAITTSTTPVTITAVTDANHATISTTAANVQASAGCLVFGHADDSYAVTLETAYAADTTQCPKIMLAAANYLWNQPHFNTQPVGCSALPELFNSTYGNVVYPAGYDLEGRGPGNTVIHLGVPFPMGASKTTVNSLTGYFAIPVMGTWRDFQMTGDGQAACNVPAASNIILATIDKMRDMLFTNFCFTQGQGIVGIYANTLNLFDTVNNSGFGDVGVATAGAWNQGIRLGIENSPTNNLINYGGTSGAAGSWGFNCILCVFGGAVQLPTTTENGVVANNGVMYLKNTYIQNCPITGIAQTNAARLFYTPSASISYTYFDNVIFRNINPGSNTGTSSIYCGSGPCVNYFKNTYLTHGSAGNSMADGYAGSIQYDQGGNFLDATGWTTIHGQVIGEANSSNVTLNSSSAITLSANWGTSPTKTAFTGGDFPTQFTITNGSGSTGASPTIAYVFPNPLPFAPYYCTATQQGGTNATGTFTSSALSATGVTFTFSLTPTASDTEIVSIICATP